MAYSQDQAATVVRELPLNLYQELKTALEKIPPVQSANPFALHQALDHLQTLVQTHHPLLLRCTQAPQTIQRELAVRLLGFSPNPCAPQPELQKVLHSDPDGQVRRLAAESLGLLGDANSVTALCQALQDRLPEVRQSAIRALGTLGDDRAVQPLLAVLKADPVPELRAGAATALAAIGSDGAAEPMLEGLAGERHPAVRERIAEAARRLRGDWSPPRPADDPDRPAQRLALLAGEMREVEDKLRDDRHDVSVQDRQRQIEEKIAKLIREVESSQQAVTRLAPRAQAPATRGPCPLAQAPLPTPPKAAPRPASPAPAQRLKEGGTAWVQDDWARLPAQTREQILQAYGADLPVQWRNRLAAYFFSVAKDQKSHEEP